MAQDSIAIYPYDVWEEKVDMLTSSSAARTSPRSFSWPGSRCIPLMAWDMTQGRVLLPAALRELFLTNAQGVQVSGTTEYVRITPTSRPGWSASSSTPASPNPLEAISEIQARARMKSSEGS